MNKNNEENYLPKTEVMRLTANEKSLVDFIRFNEPEIMGEIQGGVLSILDDSGCELPPLIEAEASFVSNLSFHLTY